MQEHALDCYRRAGRIAAQCRNWALDNIRPGVEVRHVLETIEAMIRDAGAAPAFPAQSSRNHVAAHYCSAPGDSLCYEEGDCVKVDIGVHVEGYVGDTAGSVDLSGDGRWGALIQASRDALTAAIAVAGPGVGVGQIGAAVERTITRAGFEPVRNLTGHGLGRWRVHTAPHIPNYAEHTNARLEAGNVVAIEPFASTGRGYIHAEGKAEVFMLTKPPRKARGIDRDVLRAMESWRGLPIARRYFLDHDERNVEEAIARLARQGALTRYPPLAEEPEAMVSQSEHSLYISDEGVEVLTA
ncbi:MAG: type II methionyl aminopeptidase [Planctomycetota bacterium]|nr:type II methionyl aminopeptidase [Planctomycetota bacterium]MDP6837624.1 type II methionyl aminopeptidase [Planctomycetota bacterium]MDP6955977.1 type II methionyl aminopeptidase [Planctomycetota bacterium]